MREQSKHAGRLIGAQSENSKMSAAAAEEVVDQKLQKILRPVLGIL